MTERAHSPKVFRVADLSQAHATKFDLPLSAEDRATVAAELDATSIKKLTFSGQIAPLGKRGWRLNGKLGATVVQPCVVTLAPVTTRIDSEVVRTFVPPAQLHTPTEGSETEIPEDDSIEELGSEIDVYDVMIEALAIAIPDYPRAADAELDNISAIPEGAEPIKEEETKPFAGLAALRDKLSDPDGQKD